MVGIKLETEKKYMIMAEKQRRGYPINFNVMYYAKSDDYDSIDEEIGAKEGELIREYMPPLNTQIRYIPKRTLRRSRGTRSTTHTERGSL